LNVSVSAEPGVKDSIMASPVLKEACEREEAALNGAGRILVRPSGTEALIRVMVEAKTEETARETAQKLVELVKSI